MSPDTVVDFLRHGEPVGGRRFRGCGVDDPLSDTGWQQMWRSVGERQGWSQIISSPMQRCAGFAQALSERHDVPVEIDQRFREVGFGDWEGRSPDELLSERPEDYKAFYADPVNNRPAGAEPLADFAARVSQALEDIVRGYPGQRLLVVAHAGVIRAALGHVLQSTPAAWYRARIDNAAMTRISYGTHGYRLDFHNRDAADR